MGSAVEVCVRPAVPRSAPTSVTKRVLNLALLCVAEGVVAHDEIKAGLEIGRALHDAFEAHHGILEVAEADEGIADVALDAEADLGPSSINK